MLTLYLFVILAFLAIISVVISLIVHDVNEIDKERHSNLSGKKEA